MSEKREYQMSKERLLQNAVDGINEQLEIINKKNFKCDDFHKIYCSMMTSFLDINQRKLGHDCSEERCIFKNMKIIFY